MRIFIFLILAIHCNFVSSQSFPRKYKYSMLGFNINAMNYLGELDPSPGYVSPGVKFTRYNVGISLSRKLTPSMYVRFAVSNGRIEGSDDKNASYSEKDIHRKIRNLSFRSTIWEFKSDIIKEFFPNRGKPGKRYDFNPYFFTGIAYFHHNPQAKSPDNFGGRWVDLQPLALEGKSYSLHQIAIPAGIGFKYKLSTRWDLSFEMGWRFTFTDYLDDVSSVYKDRSYFGSNELAIAMSDRSLEGLKADSLASFVNEKQGYNTQNGYTTINGYGREGDQRGESKRKDWYLVSGFHFNYIIYSKVVKCPPKFRSDSWN